MFKKFRKWWNTPATWGELVGMQVILSSIGLVYSLWALVHYGILDLKALFGITETEENDDNR